MAGIGFRLQNILRQESYTGLIQAYVYAAVVSVGPWLLSILGLALIGAVAQFFVASEELKLFRLVVTYTYAGSLILTGAIQMGTTRYLADRVYLNDIKALAPCYHWVGAITILGGGLFAGIFYTFAGLDLRSSVAGVLLFQAVCLTWMGMLFLSAAKDYIAIVRAFALGYGLSLASTGMGALYEGLPGMLWGFAIGQIVLAILLSIRIQVEFPTDRFSDSDVLESWKRFPHLAICGFTYNLGIWADKIAFWAGPYGERVRGIFYCMPSYDLCVFLGYLTIVPAMCLFLIRIETAFYRRYSGLFGVIVRGADLPTIRHAKEEMIEALKLSVARLLKTQGGFSLALLIGAPSLVEYLGIPPSLVPLLRIAILSSFLQVLLLILFLIMLYLEQQREVTVLSVFFAFSNGVLTVLTFFLDPRFLGWGYLLSCLLTLLIALIVFDRGIRDLEYLTFTKQPLHT